MSRYKITNGAFLFLLAALVVTDIQVDISLLWYLVLALLYSALCAAGSFMLSAGFFLRARCRGDKTGKRIAITFDDGPVRGKTERILDILETYHVQAAFFCIGRQVDMNKDLLRRIDAAGHLAGNHTYHHKNTIGFFPRHKVVRELVETDTCIEQTIGKRPRFFRPPFGVTNPMIADAVAREDYQTVGWSIRSYDTVIKNPARLLKRITASLTPGDIVLFHDYCDGMISILPDFIEFVRRKGFEIVRLDELLNENAYR